MSYFTAPPFDSGPPGPLRVTPGLGDVGNAGAATNFYGKGPTPGQCPCTPMGDFAPAAGVGLVLAGAFYLLWKTRPKRR